MAKDDGADDPYRVLGVSRTASAEEIRRAFRAVAKRDHPDLNPGDAAAEARFKAASAAHDLLSDPERRARYDRGEIDATGQERAPPGAGRAGAAGAGAGRTYYRDFAEGAGGGGGGRYRAGSWSFGGEGGAGGPDDLGDIFAEYFGRGGAASERGPRRGRDRRYRLVVPFLDAVNGATTRVTLADGRERDLRVPPGVEDGQTLRLRGQGDPGREGGPDGDALVEVALGPSEVYVRRGRDLEVEVPVTVAEAVLGARVTVPTPRGEVSLSVPPRSDAGTRLRLRGRGVAAGPGGDPPAGDLHAVLRIVLGPVDERLESLLRDWTKDRPDAPDPRRALREAAAREEEGGRGS